MTLTTTAKSLVFLCSLLPSQSAFVLEGSRHSYAQFRRWEGGTEAGLSLELKTEAENGLLLYTDHSANSHFLELKLVGGNIRLRLDFGSGSRVVSTQGRNYSDNAWHKVEIERRGANISLIVDSKPHTLLCHGPDLLFGDPAANVYVYIGGVPAWFGTNLKGLSVPSVVFEPTYRGAIRNVLYREASGAAAEKVQEMMAYKGVRSSTVDVCRHESPCRHGGTCISTDQGPVCECDRTGYTGVFCEQELSVPEASFRGRDGIKYNILELGGQPVLSSGDRVSLYFKTRKSSGLIFYNGHGSDFLLISLKEGGVSLTVSLESGQLDTAIKPAGEFFNDNLWHLVTLSRDMQKQEDGQTACQVTLTVDGKYTERWRTVGKQSHLWSSLIIMGGSEGRGESQLLQATNNLVGCLKEVEYQADAIYLDLLGLAREGSPLMAKLGEVPFLCQDIGVSVPLSYKSLSPPDPRYIARDYSNAQAGVISFSDPQSFLVLPSWRSTSAGSISLKIRTSEADGVLIYNGGQQSDEKVDFFSLELVAGSLYIHMNLGSGPIRIQAARTSTLADAEWHKVELSLNRNHGKITIDGETEVFTTPGQSDELDLSGPFYLGGLDYLEPGLTYPPAIWSASLRKGYVGCMKELNINGANIDLVSYAHQQDSGSIRTSCHTMPGRCHDRPCLHGGLCTEGWNRYICDCSGTSFNGPTCGRGASTVQFSGDNFLQVDLRLGQEGEEVTEAQDISLRFRTQEKSGLLLLAKSQNLKDALEVSVDGGQVKVFMQIGHYEKTLYLGQSLNDDFWHTVRLKRRGRKLEGRVDDEEVNQVEALGAENVMTFGIYHVGGISPRSQTTATTPSFNGRLQQLVINGQRILDEAHLHQLQHEGNVKFQQVESSIYNAISFSSHHTYLGMPQLKAYNQIDVYFQFKTLETDGLVLYNGGKEDDFLAIELVSGHIQYTFNMGYGPVTLRDNLDSSLADNKFHSVWIRRQNRYKQVMVIDNYHTVSSEGLGDNYFLNLDGILYLGGVNSDMLKKLPSSIRSKFGFQGCLASLEINREALDPNKDALVTSPAVAQGCQESVAYEFTGTGGVITYSFPDTKFPDTKADQLTVAFITLASRAVLVRVNSAQSNDFLEMRLEDGHVFLEYNLGTESISISEQSRKFNDGVYHTVRFSRSGPNSTLQVDDNKLRQKRPDGRYLTVFNSQCLVQVGGRWNEKKQSLDWPFQGVIAGLVYNNLRPLDMAANKEAGAKIRGSLNLLTSIPHDYKVKALVNVDPPAGRTGQLSAAEGSDGLMNCDDDELCEGSGYPPLSTSSVSFTVSTTTSSLYSETTTTTLHRTLPPTPEDPPWVLTDDPTKIDIWNVLPIDDTTSKSVKCYDDKHNVLCDEVTTSPANAPKKDNRGMSGTMSLVIGIILGSFIAMILIVIIVLKVRTGADFADCKQEEMRRYQFSSPSVTEKEDNFNSAGDTASTSLINNNNSSNSKSNHHHGVCSSNNGGSGGGFFNGGLTALNGERARLFKKANSYGRPVREWYV